MRAALKSTSSTSSRSRHPSTSLPTRRHWLIGGLFGALLALLIAWMTTGNAGTPTIRVAGTERALSTLIVDGNNRVLLLNARGPQDARAVLGTLSRPWEPEPATVVAGADRDNAAAIWETLQRLRPRQLIIAGAPGADPAWNTIERYCRESGIEISYLEHRADIELPSVTVTVVPPDSTNEEPSYVLVATGDVRAAAGLGGLPPSIGRLHLAVSSDARNVGVWSDVWITPGARPERLTAAPAIRIDPGERIDALLEPTKIRLQGAPARGFERN